jgi:hypothetical protein
MIKHLFYRVVSFLLSLFTPNPLRVSEAAYATLERIAKNYEKMLDAETDIRLASYNRQFSADTRERALRDLSDGRTNIIRENRETAQFAADRLKDIM